MNERIKPFIKIFILILALYLFLVSINAIGAAFKLFGKEFAEQLMNVTTNPLVGLSIGIIATSLMQSSSTTTSLIVGLVASGALGITNAIPMIMGANIGTTVTNTLVSLGHIRRRSEFGRALAGATVHDFFNIIAVLILLPLELTTHLIGSSAKILTSVIFGTGGITFVSPLKVITSPVVHLLKDLTQENGIVLLIIAGILLFISLELIIKSMKSLVLGRIEVLIDNYLFKNAAIAFILGMAFTAIVQSSSITTSLMIPLIGAGILSLKKLFPYTLGANIGTTSTALLASLATANLAAVTVAVSHLLFNVFGIIFIYPIKWIPIKLAETFGKMAAIKRRIAFLYLGICFYLIPLLIIMFWR